MDTILLAKILYDQIRSNRFLECRHFKRQCMYNEKSGVGKIAVLCFKSGILAIQVCFFRRVQPNYQTISRSIGEARRTSSSFFKAAILIALRISLLHQTMCAEQEKSPQNIILKLTRTSFSPRHLLAQEAGNSVSTGGIFPRHLRLPRHLYRISISLPKLKRSSNGKDS